MHVRRHDDASPPEHPGLVTVLDPAPSAPGRMASPVAAEVFLLWLDGAHLEMAGPSGPGPFCLAVGPDQHPLDVVVRAVGEVVARPRLIHSTSWRQDRRSVLLSLSSWSTPLTSPA